MSERNLRNRFFSGKAAAFLLALLIALPSQSLVALGVSVYQNYPYASKNKDMDTLLMAGLYTIYGGMGTASISTILHGANLLPAIVTGGLIGVGGAVFIAGIILDENSATLKVKALDSSAQEKAGLTDGEFTAFNSPENLRQMNALLNQLVYAQQEGQISSEMAHAQFVQLAEAELSPKAFSAYEKLLAYSLK